jgi:hypothetical protein
MSPTRLPTGPTLVVATTQDGPQIDQAGESGDGAKAWKIGELIDSPIIAVQNQQSPLLRHVQLQNVLLDGGRDIEVSEAIGAPTTLLETAEGARVLVSVERGSGRLLLLSADLDTSDLPLRIAFPVMMTNAMNWFFRQTGEMNPAIATGQVTKVPWDVAGDSGGEAVLADAAGNRKVVTVSQDRAAIGPIDQVGVFGLLDPQLLTENDQPIESPLPRELIENWKSAEGDLIAVNLCDASESDLRVPQLSLSVVGDPPAGGASAWFYLAMLAIGLVVGEWALFNRRVVA